MMPLSPLWRCHMREKWSTLTLEHIYAHTVSFSCQTLILKPVNRDRNRACCSVAALPCFNYTVNTSRWNMIVHHSTRVSQSCLTKRLRWFCVTAQWFNSEDGCSAADSVSVVAANVHSHVWARLAPVCLRECQSAASSEPWKRYTWHFVPLKISTTCPINPSAACHINDVATCLPSSRVLLPVPPSRHSVQAIITSSCVGKLLTSGSSV